MTKELITVEIPGDIPECCWPNSRCHWAARAREVAMMRDVSRLVADSYLSQNRPPVTLDAVSFVKVTWHHTLGKHKRQRDIDNTIAATKPIQDGVFDALSINGLALLHADISDAQARLIRSLGKQVIVVPDQDAAGMKVVDRAIELGWSVSMPEWVDCKDVNDAVKKYGKLATLLTIMQARETSKIKIEIRRKQLVKKK